MIEEAGSSSAGEPPEPGNESSDSEHEALAGGATGRARRVRQLFWEAQELPKAKRLSFLEAACGGDSSLRAEVRDLLRADESDSSFMEADAIDDHAELLAEDEPAPRDAGERIGRYQIERLLGEGGMGQVYLAQERGPLERPVALKVIKGGGDSAEFIGRFDLERRALARMTHAHIARIFDAGSTDDGRPYFAMEYVEGPAITGRADPNA